MWENPRSRYCSPVPHGTDAVLWIITIHHQYVIPLQVMEVTGEQYRERGFAHNGLVAPGAVGSDRGQSLVIGPWGVWLFFGCHSVTSVFPAAMFGCAKMGVLAHSLRR